MADEKTSVRQKPESENKFIAFFRNLPGKIAAPFKNMWHELKKVTWPTRKDLITYTGIVLIFMAFMGLVIGLLDMGASRLVTAISSLHPAEAVETTGEVASDEILDVIEDTAEETAEDAADAAEATVEGN